MPEFHYTDLLPLGPDTTEYRLVTTEGIDTVTGPDGRTFLTVDPLVLQRLAEEAIKEISFYLRPAHLKQLGSILDDPEASNNDKYVALDLLKNANISAGGVLPMCQDTGTAIIQGKRGQHVLTEGSDEVPLAKGIYDAYTHLALRYSQNAPLTMWKEVNTGTNLPAQIEIYADTTPGKENEYHFLFIAKGGGSANKSFLYQETRALLNEKAMMEFLEKNLRSLGTSACPPYHLVIVVGGTSAEYTMKVAKLASTKYLDSLPTEGSPSGHGFRDLEMEEKVLELTRGIGIGAQFGGKYFCHDVRVVRLPRHGASLPVAIAVSCSADRQAKAKITPEGAFLEVLEHDPAQYMPEHEPKDLHPVQIDLTKGMDDIRAQLSQHPVGTLLELTGPIMVGRDIVHAVINEELDSGEPMRQELLDHPIYYAGPAKTPAGMPSGSFGPTTAGRMDTYVRRFQSLGGSLVMLAKGNRSPEVAESCKEFGGFYLGSIGGPAARLAQDCIKKVEQVAYEDLGMEALWRIEVERFPAFIVIDDKGNDLYAQTRQPNVMTIGLRPGMELEGS